MIVKLSDGTFFNVASIESARGDASDLYVLNARGGETYYSGQDAALILFALEKASKPVRSPRIDPQGHKYSAAELCPKCQRSLAENFDDCAEHHRA